MQHFILSGQLLATDESLARLFDPESQNTTVKKDLSVS